MAEKQMQEIGRLLNHLRENAPAKPTNGGWRLIDAHADVGSGQGGSCDAILDDDHPYSSKWPEVFCNGREDYGEEFYSSFPFLKGIDPFDEEGSYMLSDTYSASDITTGSIGLRPGFPDLNAEAPPALAFVNSLISLELDDLPDDDQNCPICMEQYRVGKFEEMPLELPCGHVIGRDCLLTWLSTFSDLGEGAQINSCPHCRSETPIEQRMSIDTPAGLAQLLRDANYLLTGSGPLVLDRKTRQQWEVIKKYANYYLEERRLYDRDHALLEEKRKMNERKVEIFMVLVKDHIASHARSISSFETQKREKLAGYLINALRWFERRGLVEVYLDMKDGMDAENGDIGWTIEAMNTELAALPYPIPQMMAQTYSQTLV